MTAPTAARYQIIVDSDALGQRITATTVDGIEIVGAYRPAQLNDWRVYLTKLVALKTGLPQPHKVHACSHEDAVKWVNTLATLYTMASA